MADINSNAVWSETDSSNTSLSPFPGFPENQNPSTVNDAARSLMGAVKRWYNHANATATSGGSANAQTLTYTVAPGSLVTGDAFCFIAGASNSGSTTLNVNALGATTIKYNGANLVGGEIVSGQIVKVVYDGTNFQLLSKSGGILNPGFTTGSVVFQGATGLAQDNANFFYDGTNHNLGLGAAAASNWRLNVTGHGTTSASYSLVVQNSAAAGLLYVRDDGLVSFPLSYGNGALSVTGTGLFSGTLAVGYGGTGTTTSTGTGSNVLSASPTFTGTATFAGIVATGIVSSGPGNQLGTPSGNFTTPLTNNTNLLLYNNGATNWAGIGADTGGTMYFVTGTSGTPATRLTIDPGGTSTFTGTVGASGWNISAAGACNFNGNVNTGGAYEISGIALLSTNGNYTQLNDSTGAGEILLGNASDQTNYYRNTLHDFQTRSGGATLATINSSGVINAVGAFTTGVGGSRFGGAAGSVATPLRSSTNVLFYDGGATNWAGVGSDTGGTIFFVTGTSAPSSKLTIEPTTGFVALASGGCFTVAGGNATGMSGNATQLNLGVQGGVQIAMSSTVITCNVGVGIGTTPSHLLQLVSDDGFKPNGGSWGNSSDKRIKTNIDYNFDAMAKVRALKPALFDWIHPEAHGGTAASGGFVAQDMLDVFPEFVSTSEAAKEDADLVPDNECLNLSLHNTFFGYLVKAIQELDNEVKELKAKLQQQSA